MQCSLENVPLSQFDMSENNVGKRSPKQTIGNNHEQQACFQL